MKYCSKCGVEKPLVDFYKSKDQTSGRYPSCKACSAEYYKTASFKLSRQKYRRSAKGKAKQRGYDTSEKKRQYVRKYASKPEVKAMVREAHLRRKFGISLEIFDEMLKKQNGNCAICEKNQSNFSVFFHVDHDHKTGSIRGLLCHQCNRALGFWDDDVNLLNSAKTYLLKHKEKNDVLP